MRREQLRKITDVLWEIPQSTRKDMRVPAEVYSTELMLEALLADRSLEQLINVTTLPGIQKAAMVMPDAHKAMVFPLVG